MTAGVDTARAALKRAFPLGVAVSWESFGEFVSVRYDVHRVSDDGYVDVLFEHDQAELTASFRMEELDQVSAGGELRYGECVVRQPRIDDVPLLAEPFRDFVGWQSQSDTKWVARMRLHQSWYRTFRLRRPAGIGPNERSKKHYGNMLPGPLLPLDELCIDNSPNFTSPQALASYIERVRLTPEGVSRWRTERNMLASQPMAFNLFGPMVLDLELASAVLRKLVPNVERAVWGSVEHLSDANQDRSAFDVVFRCQHVEHGEFLVAIETKLTEPFSQQRYDWESYLKRPGFSLAVWNTSEPEVLGDLRFSQVWRNHMLAQAETKRLGVSHPPVVLVVHHPLDVACVGNVSKYRELLVDPESCRTVDVAAVVDGIKVSGTSTAPWSPEFEARYLDLGLSKSLIDLHGRRYGSSDRGSR